MPEENKPTSEYTDENKRSSIRTYEGDAARALREKNASLGSVFLAEQQKKAENVQFVAEPPKTRGILFFMIGAFLLLISSGAAYFAFSYINRDMSAVVIPNEYESAIISEKAEVVDVTKLVTSEVDNRLIALKEGAVAEQGIVTSFIFVKEDGEEKKEVEVKELLNVLGFRMPSRLFRNLEKSFAMGIHSWGDENRPFLVFTTGSYEQAFAGMLEWESLILEDLKPFFSVKASQINEANGLTASSTATTMATSTPTNATTSSLSNFEEPVNTDNLSFADGVVRNKDVRILKRGDETILIYAFPDRRTIVIADNESSFSEIISRLSADRF